MRNAKYLHLIAAVLVTTLANFGLWRWLGNPVALPDAPGGRLQCVSYTPYESGQSRWDGPGNATAATIERDLAILARYTECIRIYTATGPGELILAAAERHGLKVYLGAWIGSDRQRNALEIDAALALAQRHAKLVRALVVGNEVLLRREMPPEELAALIHAVKARSPVPVACADVAHFIEVNPVVARAADLLMIHILPYWDDPQPRDPSRMQADVEGTARKLRDKYPDKRVMIGETGFPSAGRQRGPARPGTVAEARFIRTFAARAALLGIPYNLVEALDEPWKRLPEGTVGGHWGLLDEQRQPKFPLQGPVSEWPEWRNSAGVSAVIAALALLAGLGRRGLTPGGWGLLAGFSLMVGVALVFQFDFVATTSQSLIGWCVGGLMAALTAASVLVVAQVAGGTSMGLLPPVRQLLRAGVRFSANWYIAVLWLCCALGAGYLSIALAFEPRYRDVPIAAFLCPAVALAARHLATAGERAPVPGEYREESMLAAILIACGFLQLEWLNTETYAWALVCGLLALPGFAALRVELRGLGQHLVQAAQPKQGQ